MRVLIEVEDDPVIIISSTYIKTNNADKLVKQTKRDH